jgi:hypothetical protein
MRTSRLTPRTPQNFHDTDAVHDVVRRAYHETS